MIAIGKCKDLRKFLGDLFWVKYFYKDFLGGYLNVVASHCISSIYSNLLI